MSSENEKGRWEIGFWVISFLVIGAFGWATFCHWDNENKIHIIAESLTKLYNTSNECMHQIDKRLTRIEYKLGILNNK